MIGVHEVVPVRENADFRGVWNLDSQRAGLVRVKQAMRRGMSTRGNRGCEKGQNQVRDVGC